MAFRRTRFFLLFSPVIFVLFLMRLTDLVPEIRQNVSMHTIVVAVAPGRDHYTTTSIIAGVEVIPESTVSAVFRWAGPSASLPSGDNQTVSGNFAVMGTTTLGTTSIAGSLLIDGSLGLTGDMIETTGNTFYIQKNTLAELDLMNGGLVVTTTGDVVIENNLTVQGVLGAATVAPVPGADLHIRLENTRPATDSATPSATFGSLVIHGEGDVPVALIDASGSMMLRGDIGIGGSAHVLGNFTVAGALGLTAKSSGVGVSVTYKSNQVTVSGIDAALRYAVSVSPTWNTTFWVTDKSPTHFTVHFGTPAPIDATIDWLLVEQIN